MRVLQLIPTLGVGGAQRMLGNLARLLKQRGHSVGVVSMYAPFGSSIEAELEANGIQVAFLGKRRGPDLRMVPRIERAVARFRPDVLHTHLYVLKYALPSAVLRRRCRVVHTLHNVADRELDPASRMVHALAFRLGVVPVAIGDAVAESARRVYGRSPRHTIPNGIPLARCVAPPGARDEFRRSLAIPAAAPVFVTVGRLDVQKNHAALLRAFSSERLRAAGAHLLLAGDGELRGALELQARRSGLADRVHFLGVRSDVPRVLAAADAFALASDWEGNPLAVMEAMAAGRPVVATAVGCLPELVPESAGTLVPAGSARALEEAMVRVAQDLPAAKAMGAAAERVARERFDERVMVEAYERLYAEAS